MKIARVFPSVTSQTPTDALSFSAPPGMFVPQVDEVHISVSFTWDRKRAEWLARQWESIAPVKIGGPKWEEIPPSGDFTPNMYSRQGVVFTSRGCPNKCWFCSAGKSQFRELPITSGHIVQDDNLLACSEVHIKKVFEMLSAQKKRARLMAIEAAILKDWHVDLMLKSNTAEVWCAYDTPNDYEPLLEAGKKLMSAGFNLSKLYCYCLIGYKGDTFDKAEARLRQTFNAGFMPFAMLYRDEMGAINKEWKRFQRIWMRPPAIKAIMKSGGASYAGPVSVQQTAGNERTGAIIK
jgi:hypothetical protein